MNDTQKISHKQEKAIPGNDYRRENYCKYPEVRSRLIAALESGTSAKETAKDLGISLPTLYKYKGIASLEMGRMYTTPEEKAFLDRQKRASKALPLPTTQAAVSESTKGSTS